MDQTFIDLTTNPANASRGMDVHILDEKTGEIEFESKSGPMKYILKPLAELYGTGRGHSSVDPLNPDYENLLHGIENSILTRYDDDDGLTDGLVSLTLDRLGMNPECDPRDDKLCSLIQADLRLQLSISNYSKQEVKQACRVISKSVQRHTRVAGVTGYLEFIDRQLRP